MDHGTGKTTITKFLVEIYNREELKIEIAAPTGKAAKRISEVTGHTASTVHRLLEIGKYEDSSIEKIFLDIKPIYADIIIIDEASMMDTYMITYIVRAVQKGTRLVIIGDINQLPSVGPGKVLEDLIESEMLEVVRLNRIFRQASKSNIILNAHRVNEGKTIEIIDDENHIKDLELYYVGNMEMMKTILFKKLEEEISKSSMQEFFLSSQILTPTKKGMLGTESLNKEIQEIYNTYEKQKFKTFGKVEIREKDRIMQIKNNYDMIWQQKNFVGTRSI